MKHHIKSSILLLSVTLVCSIATAQNIKPMNQDTTKNDTLKSVYQKIENGVVNGYKAIENGVVNGYTAIQDGVVGGFTSISDAFIKKFLMHDGETLEEAKARIASEEEKLHQQNQERIATSRKRSEEAAHPSKDKTESPNE